MFSGSFSAACSAAVLPPKIAVAPLPEQVHVLAEQTDYRFTVDDGCAEAGAGTPVGRTTVTLMRPCDSARSDSDSTFTAALVAP